MRKIHFVAIGGQGMSGIARILLDKGFEVSGSDMKSSAITERLEKLGAKVFTGHRAENIVDPELVVVSSAISEDNPEVIEAKKRGIPIVHRMDMLLGAIEGKKMIGVAGAHGKTTTSAMLAWILESAGEDPTYLIGGDIGENGNARLGNGLYAVVETDESDGSFLKCHPDVSVVTNIDNDHLEFWGCFESLENAFYSYLEQTKPGGLRIVCSDDELLRKWAAGHQDVVSYGIRGEATWEVTNIVEKGWHTAGQVCKDGKNVASLEIGVPGKYNLQNALGAVVTAVCVGLDPQTACDQLSSFPGVKRRLQRIGQFGGVLVLDDFAHHPSEISVALEAIKRRLPDSKTVVLFQPHRYSRTKLLQDEFGNAFLKADAVIVTGIYGGPGEKPDQEVNPQFISKAIRNAGHPSVYEVNDVEEASRLAADICCRDDVLVTMGAGDIWKAHDILLRLLAT